MNFFEDQVFVGVFLFSSYFCSTTKVNLLKFPQNQPSYFIIVVIHCLKITLRFLRSPISFIFPKQIIKNNILVFSSQLLSHYISSIPPLSIIDRVFIYLGRQKNTGLYRAWSASIKLVTLIAKRSKEEQSLSLQSLLYLKDTIQQQWLSFKK